MDANGERLRARATYLAAIGRPIVALPRCLGGAGAGRDGGQGVPGPGCARCPLDRDCPKLAPELAPVARSSLRPPSSWQPIGAGARVLLVPGALEDRILRTSTLPALARALRRRGVHVDVRTGWLAGSSYASYDVVITPEADAARAILASATLRPDARVIALDFHMLKGFPEWARSAGGGRWWPSERFVVWSAFPGYATLYQRIGVPLEQIVWRPYSLDERRFPAGGDVLRSTRIVAAGNHLRDHETLSAAADLLDAHVSPIDVHHPTDVRVGGKLRSRGFVSVPRLHRAIATSRFVVVPLVDDPRKAAGITVAVMALCAGRPVVMTATTAARDYVRDGWNGILVPPKDPRALADAIGRLDGDPALLATLSEHARSAATRFWVDELADELMAGGSAVAPLRFRGEWRWW